jgi:uncharacterized membrane protein
MNKGPIIFVILIIIILIILYFAYSNKQYFYSKNYSSLVGDKDDMFKIVLWILGIIILICLFVQKKHHRSKHEAEMKDEET